jgi:acetyltransferase
MRFSCTARRSYSDRIVFGQNRHMSTVRTLLFPRSLAVVGASPRQETTIANVLAGGIPVWGVNPNRADAAGLGCWPSVADLPEVPEAVLLLVNHERVEAAVEEAARAGVRAFVVPGLGAEAGVAGRPVRERLAGRLRELGAVALGPNCMGAAVPNGASTWTGTPPNDSASGHVSVVSQSGSIGEALLSLGGRVGFRCVVSCGGEMVTDAADLLEAFADDEGTRAIGLFLETIRRPDAFAAALARCAAAGKPVVCLKVGRSEAAARAALTHTGALVGSDRAVGALLHRYGVIRVEDFHELVETLELLGRRRRPQGTRIGAVSESGGGSALLADHAESADVPLPRLPDKAAAALTAEFPNFLAPSNPLDAWAVADEYEVYPRALELVTRCGAFDVVVAQVDLSQFRGESEQGWCGMIVRSLAAATDGTGVLPAVVSVHSADPPRAMQALAREHDLPLLRGTREAMLALARVARWRPARPPVAEPAAPDAGDLLGSAGPLPEHESSLLLERAGVPFAPHLRASTPEEAARAAARLGLPVVVKLDGPAHKSRAGGVVLGVETPQAAAEAARSLGGGPVLVARQVPPGPEALCGMTRDPHVGPVLAVGVGGTAVEELGRVAVSVPPLDHDGACELAAETGIEDGLEVVAATLVALSRLALAYPRIASIDVNPLILAGAATVAVDALVVVEEPREPA